MVAGRRPLGAPAAPVPEDRSGGGRYQPSRPPLPPGSGPESEARHRILCNRQQGDTLEPTRLEAMASLGPLIPPRWRGLPTSCCVTLSSRQIRNRY